MPARLPTVPGHSRLRRLTRRALRLALLLVLCAVVSFLALEATYRLQPVDSYRGELREYNRAPDLGQADGRPTVLLMGDSLTAGNRSYPALVREARPDLRVINAGIPGSCVLQANLVAPARFARFRPSVFIYQVNVANDLINLRYPVQWRKLSLARNTYWTAVHHARSVEYLNYKLGQTVRARRYARALRHLESDDRSLEDVVDTTCVYDFDAFDPRSYPARERLYLKAEPSFIENQVLLLEPRRDEYDRLLQGLLRLLARCEPPDCAPHLLVVPHASQVAAGYLRGTRLAGGHFDDPLRLTRDDYPFLAGIRDFLEQNGMGHVRVLDALPALRAVEADRHAYFLHDPHLNRCGQEALAGLVLSGALDR